MYTCIMHMYIFTQSRREKDEKKKLEDINRLLMQNILPQHVANYYLQHGQKGPVSEIFNRNIRRRNIHISVSKMN